MQEKNPILFTFRQTGANKKEIAIFWEIRRPRLRQCSNGGEDSHRPLWIVLFFNLLTMFSYLLTPAYTKIVNEMTKLNYPKHVLINVFNMSRQCRENVAKMPPPACPKNAIDMLQK